MIIRELNTLFGKNKRKRNNFFTKIFKIKNNNGQALIFRRKRANKKLINSIKKRIKNIQYIICL
jgi:hypothetical protein